MTAPSVDNVVLLIQRTVADFVFEKNNIETRLAIVDRVHTVLPPDAQFTDVTQASDAVNNRARFHLVYQGKTHVFMAGPKPPTLMVQNADIVTSGFVKTDLNYDPSTAVQYYPSPANVSAPMVTTNDEPIEVGDWVRFYQAGELQLAVVNYIHEQDQWPHGTDILTDKGSVPLDAILETRKAA